MAWTDILTYFNSDFWTELYNTYQKIMWAISDTADYVDSIDFTNTSIMNYMGYFRFYAGSTVYTTFLLMSEITVGITLWKMALKGFGFIKNLLPW